MSNIKNTPKIDEEKININRAQAEHRATWMGLIYDEAKKAGVDIEPILRRAIARTGEINGKRLRTAIGETSNCNEYRPAMFPELSVKTFEKGNIQTTEDTVSVEFGYCALVSAWQKLGFDDATCDLLCDIAMDGDRAIARGIGLTLDLTDTIAKGCDTCKLYFHR